MNPSSSNLWDDVGGGSINIDLPALRSSRGGNHADGRLSVFVRLQSLRCTAQAEDRRLLCVLLLRNRAMSTDPGTECW
jgi:hypothetical protein